MTKLAVKVALIERERGSGPRVDDYKVCLSVADAKEFQKEFNAKNNKEIVPDWYIQADGDPIPIDLTDKQYEYLTNNEFGRMFLSSLMCI